MIFLFSTFLSESDSQGALLQTYTGRNEVSENFINVKKMKWQEDKPPISTIHLNKGIPFRVRNMITMAQFTYYFFNSQSQCKNTQVY